ncbi:MAG TPA: flagellar biosynthetic protein FliO [Steroidobacteraceae bacterium]|nr:flagellar biosynthetic protein FliO [Steroidobacteraceae bacterium]
MFAAPQTAPAAHAGGLGGLGEVTLALLLVLGAVFALAWVLKRVRTFGSRVGGALDVLAQLPLGQKERAVLIRVGTAQVLLGVAPGRVSTLYVLPEPLDLKAPPAGSAGAANSPFRALLRSLGK